MLPTLKQLQYFKSLAKHLSFSKAAAACFITQSTLSASIKQLEGVLGCELLDRSGRALVLTETGERVLEKASLLLRDAEDLVQGARAQSKPLCGRFRLGVIPSIAPFLLPRFLPHLRQLYPGLQLFLREDVSRNLMTALREGRIDAALVALPYDTSGFEVAEIASDAFYLAVPNGHRLCEATQVKMEDLADEVLLLLEDGHCLRNHVLAATGGRMLATNEDAQATSLSTLVQMVDNGIGVTLVPSIAVDAAIDRGTSLKLIRIADKKARREIGLVWRRKSSFEGNAKLLCNALENFMVDAQRETSVPQHLLENGA
ncbi:Hydrogen peroxide-inducible genes activator [Pseudovibrio axinellae]|uniref:Hydrogen peroxide-inducible genes activator n=1 Tax=Pseudovibrio axinellae TaxID=989403 RepID=A0A166AZ95_9HYPH|nr:hydrogen peroxide-inducible genes activator [Pseudovibrio axinellae]KZL21742.1 Hydrogen peroxide-inducible genes activator [Pseudovibrio axinellae]SEQ21652.1 LysR family transcriptional regulator, hydrogen peroxide-inducible genes activator [Pseudovibrio axinellae]